MSDKIDEAVLDKAASEKAALEEAALGEEYSGLRKKFAELKLNPDDVLLPRKSLFWRVRGLRDLLDWVQHYYSLHDREKMEILGFYHPPLEPALDDESDWRRFERWVMHEPARLSPLEAAEAIGKIRLNADNYCRDDALDDTILLLRAAGIKVVYNSRISDMFNFTRLRGMLRLAGENELEQWREIIIPECSRNCLRCREWVWCRESDYHGEDCGLEFLLSDDSDLRKLHP